MTLNDISTLTAPQKAILTALGQITDAQSAGTSTVTYSQAKAARAFVLSVHTLFAPILRGIQLRIEAGQASALAAFDQANP